MQSKSKLKSNIIFSLAYQILVLIVPLITAPYVSRVIGVSGIGDYQFTFSIAHYFVLFSMLGVLNYGNREIAIVRDDPDQLSPKFWGIYSSQLLMGVCCLGIYYIYVVCFQTGMQQVLAFVQSIYVISGILDISWFYFGVEKFKFTTSISAIVKILTTTLIFLFVKDHSDVWIYAIIISAGELLNKLCFWIYLKHIISFRKPFKGNWKKHFRPLVILFIPVIAVSLYKYMDKIMLGILMDTFEVGIYESAEKFINLPMCAIAAVGTVMLSRITNLKANSRNANVAQYNYISMSLVLYLSCGMTFGLYGISSVFIPWFYGTAFSQSSKVLNVLLPSIIFVSWANVIRTQNLLPNNRDNEYCISVLFGAVVNLVVNLIYIPKYGAIGAAIGTTISEATVCIIQSIVCRRDMDFKIYIKTNIPFLICGFVMYLIIHQVVLKSSLHTVILRIAIGIGVYLALSLFFVRKVIDKYQAWK